MINIKGIRRNSLTLELISILTNMDPNLAKLCIDNTNHSDIFLIISDEGNIVGFSKISFVPQKVATLYLIQSHQDIGLEEILDETIKKIDLLRDIELEQLKKELHGY